MARRDKIKFPEKSYFYCLDCGYVGRKENSSICKHQKYRQVNPDKFITDYPELMSDYPESSVLLGSCMDGIIEYIWRSTLLKARVAVIDNNLTIVLEYNELLKSSTIHTIRTLTNAGFKFRVVANSSEDTRIPRLLQEVATKLQNDYMSSALDCKVGIKLLINTITAMIDSDKRYNRRALKSLLSYLNMMINDSEVKLSNEDNSIIYLVKVTDKNLRVD